MKGVRVGEGAIPDQLISWTLLPTIPWGVFSALKFHLTQFVSDVVGGSVVTVRSSEFAGMPKGCVRTTESVDTAPFAGDAVEPLENPRLRWSIRQ